MPETLANVKITFDDLARHTRINPIANWDEIEVYGYLRVDGVTYIVKITPYLDGLCLLGLQESHTLEQREEAVALIGEAAVAFVDQDPSRDRRRTFVRLQSGKE